MLYIYNEGVNNKTPSCNVLTPEVSTTDRKVLLINTRSYMSDVLDPENQSCADPKNFFLDMLSKNDDLHKEGVPSFDVAQLEDLKLSSDQTVEDWVYLARFIQQNYHKYRGFVVQNGTDNMVATATALSFMLENLGKPVVFTGSLIPGNHIYTDMKRNIILSLSFASCSQLCEVCILFDEKLHRANRSIKVTRSNLLPYDTPHFPPLATMQGGAMSIHRPLLRAHPHGKLCVMPDMSTQILVLQLGPGMMHEAVMQAVEFTTARGIVLYCFGSGNGPTRRDYMRSLLRRAQERDIVVVICTQNRYGSVNLSEYEAGRQLMEEGAISAGDMTHEATVAKLKYLFGLKLKSKEVRQYLLCDLRGEISMPYAKL